jgi:prolyl-tRNA synthetase family II
MRWSDLYLPTVREVPADAEAASHRLLVRGGYIRQLMSGHYCLLPVAMRVRAKIIQVMREELNRIGGQECLLPSMHPSELWQKTGRWELMGDEMFRVRDRKGADFALAVTHEEIFNWLSTDLRSYRQLPQIWYQFQVKFRDEPRPKSGLIRVREFTMKDSYSFDVNAEGLDRSFEAHADAYTKIFDRLGIPAIAVRASSGKMGGNASVEFTCPSDAGEDNIVHCKNCGYAANVEKAESALASVDDPESLSEPEPFDTPKVRTIEDLVMNFGVPAERQIKTLVYIADKDPVLVLLRGDHNLVEQKLLDAGTAAAVRPAHPEEIKELLDASPGSLGGVGASNLPIFADMALRSRRGMVTGANRDGVHLRGVDVDRDIDVANWADLREVVSGEPCPQCQQSLEVFKAVEVGHIFKFGTRYSEIMNATVLTADGARVPTYMGSYGIGVERAMAAIVENHHDEHGIAWPMSVAPFHVVVSLLGHSDDAVTELGERLYGQLTEEGFEVLLDDRPERPGVKLKDAELVGIPLRVTVGSKGIAGGTVELTVRKDMATEVVPVSEVLEKVKAAAAALR